jgi:hypothetical protein
MTAFPLNLNHQHNRRLEENPRTGLKASQCKGASGEKRDPWHKKRAMEKKRGVMA